MTIHFYSKSILFCLYFILPFSVLELERLFYSSNAIFSATVMLLKNVDKLVVLQSNYKYNKNDPFLRVRGVPFKD